MPHSQRAGSRTSATPIVRWAVLARIHEPPTAEEAQALLKALSENWTAVATGYKTMVAEAAEIQTNDLDFIGEEPRIGYDGKTPTIDFPRLRTQGRPGSLTPFDTRICVALCTRHPRPEEQPSSKVWSRVGLPMTDELASEIRLSRLETVVPWFRRISRTSSRWGFEMLGAVLKSVLPGRRLERKSELEVSVLGTADGRLAPYYERLASEDDVTAEELLRRPGARNALSRYFLPLVGKPLQQESGGTDRLWFSYPTTVCLADGDLQRREVLYLMRASDEAAHALGVGFDDSVDNELPRRSALQVSRWIANRV